MNILFQSNRLILEYFKIICYKIFSTDPEIGFPDILFQRQTEVRQSWTACLPALELIASIEALPHLPLPSISSLQQTSSLFSSPQLFLPFHPCNRFCLSFLFTVICQSPYTKGSSLFFLFTPVYHLILTSHRKWSSLEPFYLLRMLC